MNITNFFINPGAEIMAAYTDVIGGTVYAVIAIIITGYVLMKTESWVPAAGVLILASLFFGAAMPAIILFIFAFATALVFAAILVDVFVLK